MGLVYDCAITDRDGNPVRTLRGITVACHDVDSSSRNIERRFDIQLEQIMNGPAKSTMTPSVAHSFVGTNGSSSILPYLTDSLRSTVWTNACFSIPSRRRDTSPEDDHQYLG